MIKKLPVLFFGFFFYCIISTAQSLDQNLGIIPAPKSLQLMSGQFVFSSESGIIFENAGDQKIAQLFHDFLRDNYSLDIPVAKNFIRAPKGVIHFSSAGYNGANPEGYNLTVAPGQINVSGKNAGLFYGFQTLIQLFPSERGSVLQIPSAKIADEPRYKYRGMHLDVGRHMFPLSFIKKYIDVLAQYKLNSFHWHLTEDQGWRIEIKKYPKLTQVGAFRAQTLIGNYHDRMPQWFDNTPYGGYYTQEEVKDIVAYAGSKFITVIPEIEMPGHSLAALAAYPQLGCGDNPGPYKTGEKWGIFEDVYCAGKESTFDFLEDVLTEVIALFPSTYIHIGGDECPKTRWHLCPYCQKRIRDNKLKNEAELQSYFIHRIEKFLNSKGRQIIGWDEILEGGLAPNATVMSWRGTEGGIAAAKQNHDVIMTPGPYVYFDHLQGKATQEPLGIGGYLPLQNVYSYEPTPSSLTPDQQKHILGVQANVWTEYMGTPEKVEYMLFPRIYALSEIAWTPPQQKNYTNFSEERVPVHLARLDRSKTLYRVPTAIGAKDTTMLGAEFSIPLKSPVKGAKIYYTIDGYTPGETDNLYDKPVKIYVPQDEDRILKTIVITPSGKSSAFTTTILKNMSSLAPVGTAGQQPGLKYYFVPGDFELTEQVDTAKATEKGITSEFNLTKFRSKARTYGLIFDGYINISEDGVYTFTTSSDDGSQIWIDDQLVVDNDKKHAAFELTSAVNLLKGLHKIRIRYFQGGGGSDLRVYMSQPGKARIELPPDSLFN
jgi:hexosaminidase